MALALLELLRFLCAMTGTPVKRQGQLQQLQHQQPLSFVCLQIEKVVEND